MHDITPTEQPGDQLTEGVRARISEAIRTGQLPASEQPLAYGVADAAAACGSSRSVIYELIKSGQLPARKMGCRTLILRDDLVAFLKGLPEREAAR